MGQPSYYGAILNMLNNMVWHPVANNGLEPVRTSYYQMFDRKINLFDVYATKLSDQLSYTRNPINNVAVLIGNGANELRTGVIPDNGGATYILTFDTGNNSNIGYAIKRNIEKYIKTIYSAFIDIISYDSLYRSGSKDPFSKALHCLPLYFTYWHIKSILGAEMGNECIDIFREIISEYVVSIASPNSEEDTSKILESLTHNNRLFDDLADIYSVISCYNTIELF